MGFSNEGKSKRIERKFKFKIWSIDVCKIRKKRATARIIGGKEARQGMACAYYRVSRIETSFLNWLCRGRRTNSLVRLLCLVALGGVGICVSYSSFNKSNIGWPQQPQTEKVLKFEMVFCDSRPKFCFFKTSK